MRGASDSDAFFALSEDNKLRFVSGRVALGGRASAGEAEARHSGSHKTFQRGVSGDFAREIGTQFEDFRPRFFRCILLHRHLRFVRLPRIQGIACLALGARKKSISDRNRQ